MLSKLKVIDDGSIRRPGRYLISVHFIWLLGLRGCFVDCFCYWCCFFQGQQPCKHLGKWTVSLIVNNKNSEPILECWKILFRLPPVLERLPYSKSPSTSTLSLKTAIWNCCFVMFINFYCKSSKTRPVSKKQVTMKWNKECERLKAFTHNFDCY